MAIRGYAELLLLKTDDYNLKRYTNNILIATKRSADLTSQLLAFARKGKYLTTSIDLHSLINEVIELLKYTIDKRINITSNFMSKEACIKGDPSQIQNALMNLVINSRDAIPEGGEISIITEDIFLSDEDCNNSFQYLTSGPYVQISVNDNGCGIDIAIQKKIFDPFFTTKESGKGTGMGLAAVYGTITNHSGSVSVYSEVNQGTSIKILLPFCKTVNSSEEQNDQKSSLSNSRILIIDDEELVLNVTSLLLEEIGHKVKAYNKGSKAIEYYKNNWQEIDLVLIDMIMPELSGKDVFLQMKAVNPKLIAILYSGFSINGEAQDIIEEGVNRFIQKPFTLKGLSEEITKALSH